MRITDGDILAIDRNAVSCCPPNQERDVFNTGQKPLRCIYVVAKTK